MTKIPKKIISRKQEITDEFLGLLDSHIADILAGRIDFMHRVKDFAALLHIHPTHFSNTIKLTTGKSPCDFVEERIILEARKMLDDLSIPIKDIAYHLTFQEPTNFTKFFKAMEGITPRQYRQRLLQQEPV